MDICHLRETRQELFFAKLETCGNDYIFLENFDGGITCPESLCITACDRHTGIGADGLILMERSEIADAKMRMFNADGSEGQTAGNALRCMGKYLHDNGIVSGDTVSIEMGSKVYAVKLYTINGKVTSATVSMGKVSVAAGDLPTTLQNPPSGGLSGTDRWKRLPHHLRVSGQSPLCGALSAG